MDKEYITLANVKVIFCDIEDKGYGKNIVIDATDEKVRAQITEWVANNKIGKNAGVASFKEYTSDNGTTTYQYTFKIGKFTQIGEGNKECYIDDGEIALNRGDTINLSARAYAYDHPKFGKGVSSVLTAVYLKERGEHKSALQHLAEA